MIARIWNRQQLQQTVYMAMEGGYVSEGTGDTIKVLHPDTKKIVLQAMKHPSGKWIARYDDKVFKEKDAA